MPLAFLMMTLTSSTWMAIAMLAAAFVFGFVHNGSFDLSAVQDVVASQSMGQSLALVAASVLPAGAITGAQDVVLINTANAPGNQTTRTAQQLLADLTQQLGYIPPAGYQWLLTIVHQGTGTLTLVAGSGVTLGSGTNSVATTGNRTYLCTLSVSGPNPAITIQTTGSGSA